VSTLPDISGFLRDRERDRGPTMRERERERRDFRRAHPDLLIRTETVVLTVANSRRPGVVDKAREQLVDRLTRWLSQSGREAWQVNWETTPPDERQTIELRLSAATVHRTDGEWPALHRAMAEDEADRAEALRERAADPVRGPLDALRRSADWWTDPELRGL
jgi:hypothetical protein